MASVITDRVGTVASGGSDLTGSGIIVIGSVAGTNAITGVASPAITSYETDGIYLFRPANANTGAVTVNFGGGAVDLRNPAGDALTNGQLSTSRDYLCRYTGSLMRIIAPF